MDTSQIQPIQIQPLDIVNALQEVCAIGQLECSHYFLDGAVTMPPTASAGVFIAGMVIIVHRSNVFNSLLVNAITMGLGHTTGEGPPLVLPGSLACQCDDEAVVQAELHAYAHVILEQFAVGGML